MSEHPITEMGQSIRCVVVSSYEYAHEEFGVGREGVTRIEATTKSGMSADIPYIRVWKGDQAIAEFCQHSVVGVYFDEVSAT